MKRLTLAAGVTICAASLLAGVAFAKPDRGNVPMNFEQLDTDGDGQITRAEMEELRAARKTAADADGDGAISLAELEAHGAERAKSQAQKTMDRLDANADGVLTSDEMMGGKRAMRRFDRIDTDNDGSISKAEFDAVRDRMAKRRHKED